MASRRASAPHPHEPQPGVLDAVRRHVRKGCDEGAGSLISYIIAAAFFLVASSFLVNFAAQPSGANSSELEHAELRATATNALSLLLGTPGYPASWLGNVDAIRSDGRLGLVEDGATIRLDPAKFDALARGRLESDLNGYIDYSEAKSALGLSNYDFHIRAYPVVRGTDTTYGTSTFGSYRVAYIGDYTGETPSDASTQEAAALQALTLGFDSARIDAAVNPGDVFPDATATLREHLVPLIGSGVSQVVIANGAGATDYDFRRVAAEDLAPKLTTQTGLTTALALSDADGNLGYKKGREIRAILGVANLATLPTTQLLFKEWVDSDKDQGGYDAGDYGYMEISTDGGATWCKPTGVLYQRSQDVLLSGWTTAYQSRLITIDDTVCPGVANNEEVIVAAHWVGDNDNNAGWGWVIDDVEMFPASTTGFHKTFEDPEYDMLVVGSDVDQNALASEEVKNAIRDYVDIHGGRILVLGGDSNTQWLQPLFHVGIQGASEGVASPDTTHPLLTVPNALDWDDYNHGDPPTAWGFQQGSGNLFNTVVSDASGGSVLAISSRGAFGGLDQDGTVMLTTYLPHLFTSDAERARFFANAVTYGRFHSLYMEVGPEVPDGITVATASRSAMMNIMIAGEPVYEEIAFQLYIWPGETEEQTAAETAIYATPPRDVEISWGPDGNHAGRANITINWTPPASEGSGTLSKYWLHRGHADGFLTTQLPYLIAQDVCAVRCTYVDDNLEYGKTYFYNVTAETNIAGTGDVRGTPSRAVSATPLTTPGAPTNVQAVGAVGEILLSWDEPAFSGGSVVTGYKVYLRDEITLEYELLHDLGNVTELSDVVVDTSARTYKITAINGGPAPLNESAMSDSVTTAALAPAVLPDAPTLVDVAALTPNNLTITWTAPGNTGTGSLTGFVLYVSPDGASWAERATLNSPANVSFTDAYLGTNETRHYKLTAVTAVGESDFSATDFAKTMAAPDTPTTPLVVRVGTTGTVSWTAPPSDWPVDYYKVWRGESEGDLAIYLGSTSALSFVDVGASQNKWYGIKAVAVTGTSDAATVTDGLPDAPTMVDVTASSPNNLTITWTAPVNKGATGALDGYVLYHSTDGSSWSVLTTNLDRFNVSFEDRDLGTNVTKYYKVAAVAPMGEGDASLPDSKKTMAAPDTPVSPLATRLLTTTTLTWVAPPSDWPVDYYMIWSGATQGAETTYLGTSTTLTKIDSSGSAGKWYVIKAVAPTGTSHAATVQSD